MGHILQRQLDAELPVAVAGDGVYLIDESGKRYLDASAGAAVSALGHSDAQVRRAIVEQVESLAFAHTSFFTTRVAEELAEHLAQAAPTGLEQVFFISGGSEAIEAALKLARQYFVEQGQPQRRHFIARRQSYHGNTLGALAVGGHPARRAIYAPLLIETTHISPCYAYRGQDPDESEEQYGRRLADELEAAIQSLGPDSVTAFVAETVVGSALGAVPPVAGYFRRIREVCERYGVLLILDEVMCGMGRTGTLFACEQEGVVPDLVCVAKGLGAGYQPIGAVIASRHIYDALRQGSGALQHGHTYIGHPVACAAALAVQRAIVERDLLANVVAQGERLEAALYERFGNHPHVGDIRGRGLFRAIELVADRETKRPFDVADKLHARIKAEAMAGGLICYPAAGSATGEAGDHVLLAPPYIIQAAEIDDIVERLGVAVDACLVDIGATGRAA
ncbi:MAG TPA: aspartate aminotransferase family protein [Alphaproteobacteria bacterium]|jgi:hypothetical protein|nr:aspartate aminotransferase family protein [Alphaproteobacteria bacterium]MDP6269366.1 aspartate aminotransferase family protein [Alphaproteobacteria bacterium]MDP7164868.1 aspartate aminotransferase family protein [Alphaproteobacteria bacterium]MDP7426706.1 aspartate aminotransferase family protein [Alphaproteobacteria bacterium]HJM49424.1 aspartate aminotransferase family protein [Alphaproteobacteria bacterium]